MILLVSLCSILRVCICMFACLVVVLHYVHVHVYTCRWRVRQEVSNVLYGALGSPCVFISASPPQDLQEHKLTLKGVLETHFHADFVSGHCELSQRTGATIYFGPGSAARTQFDIHELQDNEACVLVFISLCSGPTNLCVTQLAVCSDTLSHLQWLLAYCTCLTS